MRNIEFRNLMRLSVQLALLVLLAGSGAAQVELPFMTIPRAERLKAQRRQPRFGGQEMANLVGYSSAVSYLNTVADLNAQKGGK